MFHGTLQPLAGAARTLSQLSDDGLLPRMLGRRNRHDAPLANLLGAAAAVFAADGAALLELGEGGRTARLRAGVGLQDEPGRQDIPLSPGGAVERILGGEAQVVEDWAADGRWTAARFMERAGVRAGMSVCVPGRERPFGVIAVLSCTPRAFLPEEIDCLPVAALLAAPSTATARSSRCATRRSTTR